MDGENDDVSLCSDVVEVMMVARVEGSTDAESAAVDVDKEREFLRRSGVWWEIETSSDAGVGVDGDVFRLNSG